VMYMGMHVQAVAVRSCCATVGLADWYLPTVSGGDLQRRAFGRTGE